MAEYTLFHKIVPNIDRHLVFPLLEFMSNDETYDQNDLNEHKLRLLESTAMVDYFIETYRTVHKKDVPPEYMHKRKNMYEKLHATNKEGKCIIDIVQDAEALQLIRSERDCHVLYQKLAQQFNFEPQMVEHLYKMARLSYECGSYKNAAAYLDSYLLLIPLNHANFLSALWGKLASDILSQDWDSALHELKQLKENIDNRVITNPMQSLQERTWLLHSSLFIYFNHVNGRELLIDLFLYQAPYLNVIQTVCPHLLRYLTAAVIASKRTKTAMKDLVKVIKQESYAYTDPLIEFIECVFIECDFEKALAMISECERLIDSDFFLDNIKDECMEKIRQLTFEKYFRIHQSLSLSVVADRLNMSVEQAEFWVINLIRTTRMDAKLDSSRGLVIMGMQVIPPYQKMIDKSKSLAYHTHYLDNMLERNYNMANTQLHASSMAQAPQTAYPKNVSYS